MLRRAVGASMIGNTVEWFDYGIYAYGVTYIAAALFPAESANGVASHWPASRCRF
jgi:MHS family proline/betaine transporter-like MFS transporter